jgi:lipopolysaccharide transport system ATP-binding protein
MNAISASNVSKLYRLGEISRGQLLADARRWWRKWRIRNSSRHDSPLDPQQPNQEGDFWALRDISFAVERGETLGIIGPNGAGKSTLLRIISKITAPTTGSVKLAGRIGSLLEVGTGFHPDLSGRDNIFLNGAILGMNRREVRRKFDDIVTFSGLEQFIDTPVKRYSSGMYVRLAFSVAAFLEPEILILDEVLAVGDMAFRAKCSTRIEQLIKARHTVLLVTHDIESLTKFCNRALWLDKGMLRDYGKADAVAEGFRTAQLKAYGHSAAPRESSDQRTGSGEFVVTKVSLLNHERQPSHSIACGRPCAIRLDCERRRHHLQDVTLTLVNLFIYDELGSRMFGLCSIYSPRQLPGLHERSAVLCEIPKLPLLPGNYSLSYSVLVNDEHVDSRSYAAIFEVSPGDFYGVSLLPTRANTPLCVECSWRLATDPN